jgi:RimJ/RimL family protein N-acetyltransferase
MNVILRPFQRDEVSLYHQWMGDPAIVGQHVETEQNPLKTLLVDYDLDQWQSDRLHRWLITDAEGIIMGFAHCWQFDHYEAHVEFGRVLLPAYQGRGIGTLVLQELLRLIFEETDCSRAQSISACANESAVRSCEKVGFTREARLREYMTLYGRMVDCYLCSILRHEWEALKSGGKTAPFIVSAASVS